MTVPSLSGFGLCDPGEAQKSPGLLFFSKRRPPLFRCVAAVSSRQWVVALGGAQRLAAMSHLRRRNSSRSFSLARDARSSVAIFGGRLDSSETKLSIHSGVVKTSPPMRAVCNLILPERSPGFAQR